MRIRKGQGYGMADGKRKYKKGAAIGLGIAAVVLLLALVGAGLLFKEELGIAGSIRKVEGEEAVYYMEVASDYHFEDFLEAGGASSDSEVSAFLTNCISKGFATVNVTESGPACSVISAMDESGAHVWGRNFDWSGSVPIIVRCTPEKGYASISTCDFRNITGDVESRPDNMSMKMLAIAALYVPMDGINEAGLCVADLEVNEGGMEEVNTEKPDLTVTTAIRLVLNRAATVEEATALLAQYDIHASGGISHHISISDASGASVVLEFTDGLMRIVPSAYVTNFNLANGNTAAGGESAQRRYELLRALYEENKGVLSTQQIKDALAQAAQRDEEMSTQWSVVYDQKTLSASYFFRGEFDRAHQYCLQ